MVPYGIQLVSADENSNITRVQNCHGHGHDNDDDVDDTRDTQPALKSKRTASATSTTALILPCPRYFKASHQN